MTGTLYIVSAPSGAGKTSLVAGLLQRDPGIKLSVSYTTRAPREGEIDGRHYHFVERARFEAMLKRGELLESAEVYGNYYGTSRHWVEQELAAGRDVLLEIDCQGADQVRRGFAGTVGVFILPPSMDTLRERLTGRGTDSPETVARRLAAAREEMARVPEFDYVIINNQFDEALEDLVAVIRAERLKLPRQMDRHGTLIRQLTV